MFDRVLKIWLGLHFIWKIDINPLKYQPHKMVKHTQTIRRQIANELFECVWLFCGVGALKGFTENLYY